MSTGKVKESSQSWLMTAWLHEVSSRCPQILIYDAWPGWDSEQKDPFTKLPTYTLARSAGPSQVYDSNEVDLPVEEANGIREEFPALLGTDEYFTS